MIILDSKNRPILAFDAIGIIRRIPIESRGTSKYGNPYTRGSVVLEVIEDNIDHSVPLILTFWGDEMVELVNRIGVGKKVRIRYSIECIDYGTNTKVGMNLISITGMNKNENMMYGIKEE